MSASTTFQPRPDFWIALSSTGSRIGSSSSSTFSSSSGSPKAIESSSALRKRLSPSEVTRSRFASSRFLIHATPCPCGSIISGHLVLCVTMMPFWMLNSSDGSPSCAQSPIVPASAMNDVIARPVVNGIFRFSRSGWNFSSIRMRRNSALNGPAYDVNAHASATSPARRRISSANASESAVQRTRSPESPPISLFAASIRLFVASASAWIFAFSAIASSNCAVIRSRSAWHSSSWFCARSNLFCAMRSFPSAAATSAIFGFTSLAIAVYRSIDLTHVHSPAMFELTFFALSKFMSSAASQGKRNSIVSSLIASLGKVCRLSRKVDCAIILVADFHETPHCSFFPALFSMITPAGSSITSICRMSTHSKRRNHPAVSSSS